MQVNLIIKNQISTPRNQYKLVADFMHGDADAYSDETFLYDAKNTSEVERLKRIVGALSLMVSMDDAYEEIPEVLGAKGFTDDEIDYMRDNFCMGDSTQDGDGSAQLQGVTVTFFDENGLEFAVQTQVDGK